MAYSLLLLTLMVTGFFVYGHIQRRMFNTSLPPQPPSFPLIGNIHQFAPAAKRKALHLLLERWAREYGDIFRVQLGPVATYYLNTDIAVKVCYLLPSVNVSRVGLLMSARSLLTRTPHKVLIDLIGSRRVTS
jgi:hypothetical protein